MGERFGKVGKLTTSRGRLAFGQVRACHGRRLLLDQGRGARQLNLLFKKTSHPAPDSKKAAPAATNDEGRSLLIGGAASQIAGNIKSGPSPLVVNGHVIGDVEVDGLLVVGHTGRLVGHIKAERLTIEGEVQGLVDVATVIEVMPEGKLLARVVRGTLEAAPGAVLDLLKDGTADVEMERVAGVEPVAEPAEPLAAKFSADVPVWASVEPAAAVDFGDSSAASEEPATERVEVVELPPAGPHPGDRVRVTFRGSYKP